MELYVHIPFCKQKCRYCSFTSFPSQESYIQEYIKLLLLEAQFRQDEADETIKTVYIGGGTPSLLPPELLTELISGLRRIFDLSSVEEFTAEANPGTLTGKWLDTAVMLGINRLSLGMQTYPEKHLRLLGRIHTFDDVQASVSLARNAGFSNISLDLIFGIPTQTIHEWELTTEAALSLEPAHISAYGLIPEPGTPLDDDLQCGRYALPDPEDERIMYDLFISKSADSGFHQYEISNFARDLFECRHNIGYWTQVPYLGLGVSAASMGGIVYNEYGMNYIRSSNPDSVGTYEKGVRSGHMPARERISPSEARFETMMLGLRMNRGVDEKEFLKRHRLSVDECYGDRLRKMEKQGLVIHANGTWKLTARGFDIQNSVLVELMDD